MLDDDFLQKMDGMGAICFFFEVSFVACEILCLLSAHG